MIQHVVYREEHHESAASCLEAIRERLAQGWEVVELRGGAHGPYLVLFRRGEA